MVSDFQHECEILYRRHATAIFRFAWGLCGNRVGAEDIVSETFVRLMTRAPRFETRTALAYLLTIARNVYLNGQRRHQREVALTDVDSAARSQPVASTIDPDSRLDDAARLVAVTEALRDLSENERAALLLRVDHGLPYDEIAASLDISVSAAKVRVHRARLRLAKALQKQEKML